MDRNLVDVCSVNGRIVNIIEEHMTVKAIKRYSDIRLHKVIESGTVLDVDEARADHLVKEGMAEIVKEPAKTAQRKE